MSDNSLQTAGPGLLPALTMVLGGARSGKSRYAERLVECMPAPWTYIATAEAGDDEMAVRIREHQTRRGPDWTTIEAPHDIGAALGRAPAGSGAVLVDCLTLWLSNQMAADADIDAAGEDLIRAIDAAEQPVVMVSNEVGLGIVPDNALAREFRDHAGRLNQRLAEAAGFVVFIAAGLPLYLKTPSHNSEQGP